MGVFLFIYILIDSYINDNSIVESQKINIVHLFTNKK